MVMVEYIPFAVHMYLVQGTSRTIEEKVSPIIVGLVLDGPFIVFIQLGSLLAVPCELLNDPSHCVHLVYPCAGRLEADHDQVPHQGSDILH